MAMLKKFSPGLFVLIIFSLFLPFIAVSCGGAKVISLTGVQLATGTSVQKPDMFGNASKKSQKIDGEPLVIVIFIAGIAGLLLSFLKGKKTAIFPAVIGVIGVVLMFLLKSKMDHEAMIAGKGMIQINYEAGYWLALLLFFAAALLNGFIFFQKDNVDIST